MREAIDYKQFPESEAVVKHIHVRHRKGLYTLALIYGLPGTGKSSVCIRLGQLISQEIHGKDTITEDSIIDSLLELIKFVRKAKPGDVGIIEEVSVLFPSRRSMAHDNVAIARVLDTCRKKQVILFANAPILDSIDKHIRCLAHIAIETLRIVKKQGVVVCKALRLQTNPASGKTYFHRFSRAGREVHRIYTARPDGDIWAKYESKKDKFLNDLYDKLKARAELKDAKELKELGIVSKVVQVRPLTPRELEVQQLVRVKGLKQVEAARELGIAPSRITRILKNINRKCGIIPENAPIDIHTETKLDINLN